MLQPVTNSGLPDFLLLRTLIRVLRGILCTRDVLQRRLLNKNDCLIRKKYLCVTECGRIDIMTKMKK